MRAAADSGDTDARAAHGVVLTIAYDGATFAGFARQPHVRTIAGELDGAIRAMDPRASLGRGMSRTDAGVHARAQRVAFDSRLDVPSRGWVLGLMPHLPPQIAVVRAAHVAAGFDPRRHAVRKTYRYSVLRSDVRDPFLEKRAWRVADRLNHEAMHGEAQALLGAHDFAAFRGAADEREDTVRTLTRAKIVENPQDCRVLEIEVEGDRFMYRMVRIIVGTLVDVGRGRLGAGAVARAIASRRREDLGITAPPDGLCLEHATLDDDGADAWPD